jgi:hypothetical protein
MQIKRERERKSAGVEELIPNCVVHGADDDDAETISMLMDERIGEDCE